RRTASISEACLNSRNGWSAHRRKRTLTIIRRTHLPRSGRTVTTPQALVPADDRSGPKAEFAVDDYNKVARAAKLRRIILLRSNFAVQLEYLAFLKKEGSPKPSYGASFGNQTFDAKAGR